MDVNKFLPNDKSILNELINNTNDSSKLEGGTEEFMNLPLNKQYENNEERIEREKTYIKISDQKNLDNSNGK